MYNKKLLSQIDLGKYKKPDAFKKDKIYNPTGKPIRDNQGQWKYPGQPTRIQSEDITMKGVSYPVMAYPNVGQPQMMYPNQDYNFPGADYVDEYPLEQAKKGGPSKKYSRSLEATNYLLRENPLFKKKKSRKKKIYDPNSPYFQDGGELPADYQAFLDYSTTAPENRQPGPNYFYGSPDEYDHYGMWETLGKPKNFEEALEMNPDWTQDEEGYYHGYSVNPYTGVFLKSGAPGLEEGDTKWMEIAEHYLSPRSNQNTPVYDVDLQRFKYIPKEQDGGMLKAQKGLANLADDAAKALNNKALPKLVGYSLPVPKNNVIKNISYFQQLLDNTAYAPKQRQYLQSIINTVKKQGSKASDRQYSVLQGLKSGNKGYSLNAQDILKLSDDELLSKTGKSKEDWELFINAKPETYSKLLEETYNTAYTPTEEQLANVEAGKQQLLDFYSSPEYNRRLQNAFPGLSFMDTYNYQNSLIDAVNKTKPRFIQSRNLGSIESDAMAYTRGADASGTKLGIDFSDRGLSRPDAKYISSHEYGHTSLYDIKNQKLLENLPKLDLNQDTLRLWQEEASKPGGESYNDLINYYSSPDEARQRGLSAIMHAKNKGMTTDELMDIPYMDMVRMSRTGELPKDIADLKQFYEPTKLKDYLKNLYVLGPAALGAAYLQQEEDGGTIDLELTPEEIKAYQDGGYIVEEIDDPSIPQLNKAQPGGLVKAGEKLLRAANIGTLGTLNTLAKTFAPVKINPAHIPTFGMMMGERSMFGPFTGSPLNIIPGYGKDLGKEMASNEAFRYFGDTLDYVKLFNELNSAHGPLLRMGKNTIMSDPGQWFEQGTPNASYTSVFGVRANPSAPGSNLRYMPKGNRNGVLIGDVSTENSRIINPRDPGIEFYRRLPFSQNVSKVDLDNPWDWKNYGGNMQSLLERYGYAALYAAGLAGMGYALPQEYLDENINNPIKEGYNEYIKPSVDEVYNGFVPRKYRSSKYEEPQQYLKGGTLPKAQPGALIRSAANISKTLRPTSEFRNMMTGLTGADDLMRGFTPASVNIAKPIIPKVEDADDADFFKMLNQMSAKDSRAALKDFLKGIDAKNPVQFEEIVKPNWALDKGLEDDVLPPGGLTDVGGSSLVQYGDDIHLGNPWNYVDPNDYKGLDWRKEGMKDSYEDFFKRFPNMKPASGGSGPINIGDFDFNPWSPGYNYMQRMKSMLAGEQRTLSTEDFFTDKELIGLANQEKQWREAREAYDEMYPESGADMLMGFFTGNKPREESFENLFPNVSRPNFRSKFTTPQQESFLSQYKYVPSIKNRGLLNEHALRKFMDIDYPKPQRDILPVEQQEINELRSGEDYFSTADPKMVVSEMRGVLGVSLEDIDKATPEQLEKWRQQLINRSIQQKQARLNELLENPYKTKNFYGDLNFNQSGGEHNLGDEIDLTDEEVKELERMGYTLQRI